MYCVSTQRAVPCAWLQSESATHSPQLGTVPTADFARNADFGVPDFNLDSDRGYAWHCWDWDRSDIPCVPDINPAFGEDYGYPLPCTSPQMFHAEIIRRDGKAVGYVRAASYGHTLGGAVDLERLAA